MCSVVTSIPCNPRSHPNPAQQAVIDRGLLSSGFNVVLQMPTGAGKTWLAEQAIDAALEAGRRAIYLTPLRALADELLERWTCRFQGQGVGVFTGEYGKRQPYPVPFERARVLIMTPERLDACTRHWRTHWTWMPEVSLVVVDELHLLGEPGRGPRLEGTLMRIRRLNPFLKLLGLSATLGNRAELAEWLGGVHFGSAWKPIPIQWRRVRFQRATDKPRILVQEVRRCVNNAGQSLVFVQSRRQAEVLAATLRDAGVAAEHHHAGLGAQERRRLEGGYRTHTIQVLVSTGTLEMGLNLPARQVVLYDLQRFDGNEFVPLSVNTVWQRAGRAGRQGLDTQGEVVLIAPSWDHGADRYEAGHFEKIMSGLVDTQALAEQVLAEVSSGLAWTRTQLERIVKESLAAYQHQIPALDRVVSEMIDGGMLLEILDAERRAPRLKTTRLGRIAVRQMLAPSTVVTLARSLQREDATDLSFLDLLLLCAQTDDCEPRIPVDFEELGELGERLTKERSVLLAGNPWKIQQLFELDGRRLLGLIKAALIVRAWTRIGCAETVADRFGCYAFEVRRLSESVERILTAAVAVLTSPKEQDSATGDSLHEVVLDDRPSLPERVRALAAMVAHGVDEHVVTLTFLEGIGGTLARRLRDAGITDVEELALADVEVLAKVRGVSPSRAARWIDEATQLIKTRSALSLQESGRTAEISREFSNSRANPYRLRRALELKVRQNGNEFAVTGGLEPHRITQTEGHLACDCVDFARGRECKHVLAVRMYRKETGLSPPGGNPSSRVHSGVDFFHLWFDQGRR